MHNTFTTIAVDGKYKTTSHNFDICGEGVSEDESIHAMKSAVQYYADNNSKEFKERIRERLAQGLECSCGIKLTEKPLGFHN